MKLMYSILFMFIASFVIQYFLMPPIMVNNRVFITNHVGKAYMALIMAVSMVVIEVIMHDHQYHTFSTRLYLMSGVALFAMVYFYRNQTAIDDKQYLLGMIEHHSMALLTSEKILEKTDNYHIAKLAKDIIQQQSDEIRTMRELLAKMA